MSARGYAGKTDRCGETVGHVRHPAMMVYRLAITVATEKTPAACPEGKLLPLKGDFPPLKKVSSKEPPGGTSVGRSLRVTALTARSTIALSA